MGGRVGRPGGRRRLGLLVACRWPCPCRSGMQVALPCRAPASRRLSITQGWASHPAPCRRGTAKIADLGLAKIMHQGRSSVTGNLGTLNWVTAGWRGCWAGEGGIGCHKNVDVPYPPSSMGGGRVQSTCTASDQLESVHLLPAAGRAGAADGPAMQRKSRHLFIRLRAAR